MKTFCVQTLGCKVNHYESEQISEILRARGLIPAEAGLADLRVINTCSVTTQAASQSRQSVRRMVRLPVLTSAGINASCAPVDFPKTPPSTDPTAHRPRTIVTGCWATSNPGEASTLSGVDAVLGHHHNIALELNRLLTLWQEEARTPAGQHTTDIETNPNAIVNEKLLTDTGSASDRGEFSGSLSPVRIGTTSLPLLGRRQPGRQRAFLKIQDGCDAHCTYCIIPNLRPTLWSKPVDSTVEEAKALVAAGHVEIVLTGIFLGAYGQPTALRRRQPRPTGEALGELIEAICTRVPGLGRLRLSSLEPGDLTPELLKLLRSYRQVVPHFHLPLQSGSDVLLRRMNRQYTRGQFLKMVAEVNAAFDRPALTTDIVVGFPGETDEEFERTAECVREAGFIHVHAFPYSPRPGTAAARWTGQFLRGPIVAERMNRLREIALDQSFAYRSTFLDQIVEVIIERDADDVSGADSTANKNASMRHGRCERYFSVTVSHSGLGPGDSVRVKVNSVTREKTHGELMLGREALQRA